MDPVRIGTRGSKLALWQARYVEEKLQAVGLNTELVTIETQGDKILEVSIAKIGSKGVFTEEIEEQLAAGRIDIAVHSAKDMQSELPESFELIAFSEREKVNDVLVSEHKDFKLEDAPVVIGTSSTRRVALINRFYPKVKTVPVRGNLQTRIAKMKDGVCDALMLAYAGMYRMGYSDLIVQELDLEQFTPAVGQGSVAIECAVHLDPPK
ncbi:MAG: hydroxymethylbilane synthase, partial [Bacteroidota bacterium]